MFFRKNRLHYMCIYIYTIFTLIIPKGSSLTNPPSHFFDSQPFPNSLLWIVHLQGTVGKPAPSHVLQTRQHSWFGESNEVLTLEVGVSKFGSSFFQGGPDFSRWSMLKLWEVYPAFGAQPFKPSGSKNQTIKPSNHQTSNIVAMFAHFSYPISFLRK